MDDLIIGEADDLGGFDVYSEAVDRHFTMLFFTMHYEDIDDNEIIINWIYACFKKDKSPKDAAALIERAFYFHLFPTLNQALKRAFLAGFKSAEKSSYPAEISFAKFMETANIASYKKLIEAFIEYGFEKYGNVHRGLIVDEFLKLTNNNIGKDNE